MKSPIKKPIYFKNKEKWKKWLINNHNKEREVRVLFFKKHTKNDGLTYTEAVEEAVCFGWIDGILNRIDDRKHMIRFSPRKMGSIWSKINKERAKRMIDEGRMSKAGMKTIEEAKRNGLWGRAYTNKIVEKMPLDLKNALSKEEALKNFNNFANSYKNTYIGWINSAKTNETRNKRILKVVKSAKQNIKSFYLAS